MRAMRRPGLAGLGLTAATLLLLGFCAQAGALSFQSFYEYTIAFNGKGSYTRTLTGEGGSKLSEEASWTWNTVYPNILIPTKASSPLLASGFPAYGLGQEGKGTWKITNTGSEDENCSNSGTLGLPKDGIGGGGGGGVKVHRRAGGKGVVFNLIALDGYETTSGAGDGVLPCDPMDYWQDIIRGFVSPGTKHTDSDLPEVQPLSTTVTLTPADLKHGSVLEHVSIGAAEMVASDCGSGGGNVCTQNYTWSGTVRFTKHKFK